MKLNSTLTADAAQVLAAPLLLLTTATRLPSIPVGF